MRLFFAKILLFTLPFFLLSCNSYDKLLKSTDYDLKERKAISYYDKKQYEKAHGLFEELVTVFKGTARAELVYYYYAKTLYQMGNFAIASYHFENFSKTFAQSSFVEEAYYLHAYCYYMDSPPYYLDPTNTTKAIEKLQLFINTYPKSEKVTEANALIDELRRKLEKKYYEIAKLYYNKEDYKAAIVSFKNLLKDYPDTQYKEDASFYIVKSCYLYALNSVETKKTERYQAVIDEYLKFIDKYPNSNYLSSLETFYTNAQKYISQ